MNVLSRPVGYIGWMITILAPCVSASYAATGEPADARHVAAGVFKAPAGCVVEKVAGSPLVKYPHFACFDDRGRLYVAEGTGKNLPGPQIAPLKLGKISLLEDTDGDGRFDKRTVFADGLIFPSGVEWHDGSVYVASHPAIWKLTDTNGDGVADRREELVGRFGFTGNGCDIHGPFFQPDGWLYWTQGRHGYRIDASDGRHLEGLASRVWRSRLDGTDIERIAGGGFDNTVELAFTDTADLTGTMDQYPGDMLLQYVEGGVYPRSDESTLAEFPRTGPLMTPIVGFSAAYPAALCGLVRLRSDHFGSEYPGTLLTSQFNVRRIQQHTLKRSGATLQAASKDLLLSTDWDFHPTDVLEDADGSLLIVDMGSWFNYACPTQKIAKAEVTGSIYRLRRTAAPRRDDPWGRSIEWSKLPLERVIAHLDDQRHRVVAGAAEELVRRGEKAVPLLNVFAGSQDEEISSARREAIYVLSRIGTPAARAAVRAALDHDDSGVREVALHCIGLERDADALPALLRMVTKAAPPERRKAAEALGRLGKSQAVPAILEGLRRGPGDRFLEHSLIYALIRIGSFENTLSALADPNPHVRRAGLIALDQMNGREEALQHPVSRSASAMNPYRGNTFRYVTNRQLTRAHIAPLLGDRDPAVQLALLETISHHSDWTDELLAVARQWVKHSQLDPSHRDALITALLGAVADSRVQQLVADAILDSSIDWPTRRELFTLLARGQIDPYPSAWLAALEIIVRGSNENLQHESLNVIRIRRLEKLDPLLAELGNRADAPASIRAEATAILAPRTTLDSSMFDRLVEQLSAAGDPLVPVTAAAALGTARLNPAQRRALVEQIGVAGPLTAPLLVKAFHHNRDLAMGVVLAEALVRSPGSAALPADELEEIFGDELPPAVRQAAKPLLDRHRQTQEQQAQYLAQLGEKMSAAAADVRRGEEVFFSKEARCSACHTVAGRGGNFGPDLSRIGSIRITRALLESIVFPSAAIVPDFRSYNVLTRDGLIVTGQIARETADALFVRTVTLTETRVARTDIESIEPSTVSFMPQGLEKTMTPQQLNDLLEFLYSLK